MRIKLKKTGFFAKLVAIILLVTMMFTSCMGGGDTGSTSGENVGTNTSSANAGGSNLAKDTFIYALGGDPGAFVNPITSGGRWDLTALNTLYSPLYIAEVDGSMRHELCTDITTDEEGLVYTLKLRDDVLWHDGEKFTADDVVFTMEQLTNKDTGSTAFARLQFGGEPVVAEKVDDYTVKFTTKEYNAAAVSLFSTIFIMPKHIYEGTTDFQNSPLHANPVGTGPYKLNEYRAGEYMSFIANEDFYGGKPAIENYVLKIMPNANAQVIALQNGEIDAAIVLPSDIEKFDGRDDLKVSTFSEGRVGYIMLNLNMPELDDVRVRQAIFYALSRDDLNEAAYVSNEYFNDAYTFLPPSNPFATEDVEKYEQNVEKSKAHLKEAGAENLKIKLVINNSDPVYEIQSILVQEQLKAVGIEAEIVSMQSEALTAEMKNPETTAYHIFFGGYIMGSDPARYQSLYLSDGSANYHHLKGEAAKKVDELFGAGSVEKDETKRHEIYKELQQFIQEEAIIFPLVDNKKVLVTRADLDGIDEAGLVTIYTFGDVSKLILGTQSDDEE